MDRRNPIRPPKPPTNPLHAATLLFLTQDLTPGSLPPHTSIQDLIYTLPRRYTIYPPLLLLPPQIFTSTLAWKDLISTQLDLTKLYVRICTAFKNITHIALNGPIPGGSDGLSNHIRHPTDLTPLYGAFGTTDPLAADFTTAFWISTVQNNNSIIQTWAPLFTMFSRGNVSEKARILAFDDLDETTAVVDMYAGIGYFAFSYLKSGVGRVWGWDVNRWSVEGARRGAEANGWGVRVVDVDDGTGEVDHGKGVRGLVDELKSGKGGDVRLVMFLGDNRWAGKVLGEARELEREGDRWKRVRHVNLGLLPSSRGAWRGSVEVLDRELGGWVHVHENVETKDIQARQLEVVKAFEDLVLECWGHRREVRCEHIEHVKSFAPGVMHCVFDLCISGRESHAESRPEKIETDHG